MLLIEQEDSDFYEDTMQQYYDEVKGKKKTTIPLEMKTLMTRTQGWGGKKHMARRHTVSENIISHIGTLIHLLDYKDFLTTNLLMKILFPRQGFFTNIFWLVLAASYTCITPCQPLCSFSRLPMKTLTLK